MTKHKTEDMDRREHNALLRVRNACEALSSTCIAMSLIVPSGAEHETWQQSATQISNVVGLIEYSIQDARRWTDDPFEIVDSMPAQWIHRAADSVGTLRGVAFLHESIHGDSWMLRKLSGQLRSAHNALLVMDDTHRRHALLRAGIAAVERAETNAMILRAARRVIRRRARGSQFDVGVANVPTYVIDPARGEHRIRVTPRWRSVVQRLGTATPLNHFLMLDGELIVDGKFGCGNYWWVTCARANIYHGVEVQRLRWHRPDLNPAAAPTAQAA